jgi:hypothetical protein
MFGLDFVTILMIDMISQTLSIPHKCMHILDKVTYAANELWRHLVALLIAIASELKTTSQLTFTFTISRSQFGNTSTASSPTPKSGNPLSESTIGEKTIRVTPSAENFLNAAAPITLSD